MYEYFVQQGIVGLLYDDQHFHNIIHLLDRKPATHNNRAALAWIVKRFGSSLYLQGMRGHFLLNNRDYLDTYLAVGGNINMPSYSGSNATLFHSFSSDSRIRTTSLFEDSSARQNFSILGLEASYYPLDNFDLSVHGMRGALVNSLRYDAIFFRREDFTQFHARTVELMNNAPPSARELLRPILTRIWNTVYGMISELPISYQQLVSLLEIVPNEKAKNLILRYGPLFHCSSKNLMYLAYVLGLPLHIREYSPEDIENTLIQYIQDPTSVKRRIKEYHLAELTWITNNCNSTRRNEQQEFKMEEMVSNITDSINFEKVFSYSPYDVVRYINQSGKVVQLVRTEHDYIVNNEKNPWTLEPLPSIVTSQIAGRQKCARLHGFPASLPLKQILEELEQGRNMNEKITVAVLNVPGSRLYRTNNWSSWWHCDT